MAARRFGCFLRATRLAVEHLADLAARHRGRKYLSKGRSRTDGETAEQQTRNQGQRRSKNRFTRTSSNCSLTAMAAGGER
jgi:hypothetical protein